jgi:hypothetical protein
MDDETLTSVMSDPQGCKFDLYSGNKNLRMLMKILVENLMEQHYGAVLRVRQVYNNPKSKILTSHLSFIGI